MDKIKFSIITVCRNAETTIENTIRSVIDQTYKYYEYIVIDGNSSDQTLSIIKKYQTFINHLVVEEDKGVYDGMNKAVRLATGDFLYFLNAGDKFIHENVLENVHSWLQQQETMPDLIYGSTLAVNKSDGTAFYISFGKVDNMSLYRKMIDHQSMFAKQELFMTNKFDLQYKIKADYDWLLKSYGSGRTFKEVPIAIAITPLDGLSSKYYYTHSLSESKIIKEKYFAIRGINKIDKLLFKRQLLFVTRRILRINFFKSLINSLYLLKKL